ncbi:MAG TPA: suppressor of fused domain protein [Ramlibacter sp.]|uniref:suppressor of fused domain protein n=1 Tax=Ramlibacter sp. TaxID=1917967 RepID=UPI002C778988|nr:suppressor of fused domain protein [Ramlibacter sp.]HVZ45440.1 suppressor of fused domain protein [Ramlibacter sp.]
METDPSSLPAHYEKHLGEIARGWSDEDRMHGVQVVCFESQPEPGVRSYATLGLSEHVVDLPGARKVRQELLMSANDDVEPAAIAGLMLSIAEHVLRGGKALLRGDVLGPATPVVPGASTTAIYVTNPSPFDESLTHFESPSPPTVFAYLVPITGTEAALVVGRGWKWFEGQLEEQNPDIWNPARKEVIDVLS